MDNRMVAAVMAGYDGHRGWVNYLAVAPDCWKSGYGRRMMEEAEARLRPLGCSKINLQIRSSNAEVIEFYQRIGYSVDDVVSMGKRLEDD
jgi:ribosomal protein S18 acetylase RimI-like enzyme